jgi:cytidylate kinase
LRLALSFPGVMVKWIKYVEAGVGMKIAIDGLAGAGKSTLARALAQKMGFIYIDTGAMYRALTWKALQQGIELQDYDALQGLAACIDIHFETRDGVQRLICEGEDITELVRAPEVNAVVSQVAAHPGVREFMVRRQQKMAQSSSVVMDGRDIGELVLPDAEFKFFVTAALEERAQRRAVEMELQGFDNDINSTKKGIEYRDRLDSEREVGSLKILPDSIVIDTSQREADEVLAQVLAIIGER